MQLTASLGQVVLPTHDPMYMKHLFDQCVHRQGSIVDRLYTIAQGFRPEYLDAARLAMQFFMVATSFEAFVDILGKNVWGHWR